MKMGVLGYFGNIWVRQNVLEHVGETNGGGHKHEFDHVSLLTQGRVSVEIEGHPPKEFKAPTFIVVRKGHKHKFTALEENTVWYCVFAIRDVNGEPIDDLYSGEHDPLHSSVNIPNYWEKVKELELKTIEEND